MCTRKVVPLAVSVAAGVLLAAGQVSPEANPPVEFRSPVVKAAPLVRAPSAGTPVPDQRGCVVACADGATPEGEVDCYDDYDDQYNGGCLTIHGPDMFSPIDCGQTVCGTTGNYDHYVHCTPSLCPGPDCECTFGNYQIPCEENRDCPEGETCVDPPGGECTGGPYPEPCIDTGEYEDEGECAATRENTSDSDWYQIITDEWKLFTFTIESEATLLAGLVEKDPLGHPDCYHTTDFISPALDGLEPCTVGSFQVELPAGVHWWYVAAAENSGSPCGSRYNMSLDCEPLGCLGDTCETAEVIENIPFMITRPSQDCADDYDENCGFSGSSISPDAVYSYTPTNNMVLNISLCGTTYTSKVYVYEDICDHDHLVACSDDQIDCGIAWTGELSCLLFEVGHTYYIVVDGSFDNPGGKYTLSLYRGCNPCERDNGTAQGGTVVAAQCFSDYDDWYTAADDFIFVDEDPSNTCRLGMLSVPFVHWGCPGGDTYCEDGTSPLDYEAILVAILDDNGQPPGEGKAPVGEAQGGYGTCTWTESLYEWEFVQGEFAWDVTVYPGAWPQRFNIYVDLGQFDVELEKNTKYWLSVSVKMAFGGNYQTGWLDSARQSDHLAQQWANFPPYEWRELDYDLAFFLEGFKGVCPDPCVIDEDCDDVDPCTDEVCDHEDPGADLCGCVYTPVDCDDGIECTNDSCDPQTGGCINQPNDAKCAPPEVCDPADPNSDPVTGCGSDGGCPGLECCLCPPNAKGCTEGEYCPSPYGDIVLWRDCEVGAPAEPDLDDILCIIDGFAAGTNWSQVCPCGDIKSTADPVCGCDDQINLDDILGVLDSFAGNPPCYPLCP